MIKNKLQILSFNIKKEAHSTELIQEDDIRYLDAINYYKNKKKTKRKQINKIRNYN